MRRVAIGFLAQVFLLALGYFLAPHWTLTNASILLLGSFGLLAIIICYDHWPRAIRWQHEARWLDFVSAARLFRDEVESKGLAEVAMMFDSFAKRDGVADAFRGWLHEGINSGKLVVWATPVNGDRPVRVKSVRNDAFQYVLEYTPVENLTLEDGSLVDRVEVRKSSIISYVDWIGSS